MRKLQKSNSVLGFLAGILLLRRTGVAAFLTAGRRVVLAAIPVVFLRVVVFRLIILPFFNN